WALAASLTVGKGVKYEVVWEGLGGLGARHRGVVEVWDSGTDLFEHALERLGTERPVSHVLRHVIQVVANLQELPSIREWFLKHGAAEMLDSIITEEGQDCMVVKLATTTAELLRYRPAIIRDLMPLAGGDDAPLPPSRRGLGGNESYRTRGRRRQEEDRSTVARVIRSILRLLWRCALQIFYFARFNVLLLLVVTAYACFFQGISLPIVTIKGDFMGQGSIDITKSTLESLENFFEEGFYLPGVLVLLCSVVVPIVKLLMMLVIFIIRHTYPEKAHQLMFVLRIIAKYQMLDIFVTVIMVAFLNQDVMRTTLQTGFYYYLAFCLLSIGATQVLWSMLPDRPQALYAQQLARWMHDRQAEIAFKNITGRSPDPADYPSLVHNSSRNPEAYPSVPFGEASLEDMRPAGRSANSEYQRHGGTPALPEPDGVSTPAKPPRHGARACSSAEEVEERGGDTQVRISKKWDHEL
ncbi:hypothetical protein FOZ63_032099, partial [Perkinsus olseni]